MKIIGYVYFLAGYLKSGHYELILKNKEDIEKYKTMTEDEKKNYIEDNGNFVLDDYEIEDSEIADIEEAEL